MSSLSGVMKIEQDDFLLHDQTINREGAPNFITIRDVFFLGTSVPRTSGLRANIPLSFDSYGSQDLISTAMVHRLTGISKRSLDAWANSSNPPRASVSWALEHHEDPVFTSSFCLVADTNSWIVFARDLNKEWDLANSVQRTTAVGASPNSFTFYSQPQLEQIPHRRPSPRVPCCATCGRRASKRRRTTVCDQCWAMTAASGGNQRTSPARALSSPSWDGNNTARQPGAAQSLLESAHRHATEAYMNTGSTQGLRYAAELSQGIAAARLHRQEGFPWEGFP
ncbi:hypothetical protein V8F20_002202 [Naviculisporaceae sp. PSN 640]